MIGESPTVATVLARSTCAAHRSSRRSGISLVARPDTQDANADRRPNCLAGAPATAARDFACRLAAHLAAFITEPTLCARQRCSPTHAHRWSTGRGIAVSTVGRALDPTLARNSRWPGVPAASPSPGAAVIDQLPELVEDPGVMWRFAQAVHSGRWLCSSSTGFFGGSSF